MLLSAYENGGHSISYHISLSHWLITLRQDGKENIQEEAKLVNANRSRTEIKDRALATIVTALTLAERRCVL